MAGQRHDVEVDAFESAGGPLKVAVVEGQHDGAAGARVEDVGQPVLQAPVEVVRTLEEERLVRLRDVDVVVLGARRVFLGHRVLSFCGTLRDRLDPCPHVLVPRCASEPVTVLARRELVRGSSMRDARSLLVGVLDPQTGRQRNVSRAQCGGDLANHHRPTRCGRGRSATVADVVRARARALVCV